MKGDDGVIMHLNRLLSDELIAANQCLLHSRVFNSWGLSRLHNIEYQEYTDELGHSDLYIKRILFLQGTIVLRQFDELSIKKNVEHILKADLDLEYNNIASLQEGIKYADSVHDYISRDIMIQILKDEEKHIDFLETEFNLILKIGIHNYIQSQLKHN